MIASILLRAGVLVKYILSAPFREIRTRPACAIKDCGRVPRNLVAYAMKKARSLLQNFGQLNAKTADKFLVTCLPFEAVILLYGSSVLSAKQKQPFYICEYASWNPGVWAAKNPDKNRGLCGTYLFYVPFMVGEGGFGPPKSVTTDLQSAPFGRSGIPPYMVYCLLSRWSRWRELNPQPADYKSAALPLSYTGMS